MTRKWALVPMSILLLPFGACTGEDAPGPAGEADAGDAAVWSLSRNARLSETTTTFTAGVSRLACNNGVTGTVLEPDIEYEDTRVVVTFAVEHVLEGAADCQGNPMVPYEVVLTEPLGDRELVDGACAGGGDASSTSSCRRDGVRWPVPPPDLTQLQEDASSAAEEVTSGDGLRVENRTGDRVVLVFPDGDKAWVEAGKDIVVLTPCRERLPLRAETATGEVIAERDGPCRRVDTWVLSR